MSVELHKPPVVDLEALLQPISDESPSGESLRYSGIYDQIREARRADEVLAQGEWKTELKVADFRKVVDLAVPALTSQTKDLQIGVWLTEAIVKQHGFAGLRDGLKLLAGLQDRFWESLYPEIDDGDMESRANAISWIDTQGALAAKGAPYTGVQGYGYLDWEDSKTFDIPENLDVFDSAEKARYQSLKEQADRERRVTGDQWRKERAQTRRASVEAVNFTLGECWEAFDELNRVIEEKFDRNQAPGLGTLKKSLEDIQSQVKMLLEEKRAEEPDPSDFEDAESTGDEESDAAASGGPRSAKGAIQNRADALNRLSEIAAFLQKTEPHSPVSYLVQRAVRWGNMPLDSWLQDVIKDQSVLYQLRETLGFNNNSEGG